MTDLQARAYRMACRWREFSTMELRAALGLSAWSAWDVTQRLHEAGWLERVGRGRYRISKRQHSGNEVTA